MKNGEIDSEWEQRKSWPFVLGKQESESFLKADRTKQKVDSAKRKHSHADVSSLCICYYFHCPRTTPKGKSSSSHNNTGCDNALLCGANVIFRMGAGCLHSTGELLRGTIKSSSITFSFSCPALTGAGSVGQSSWRLIPCLQLWQRSCSSFILFLTHIKMWQSEDLWDDQQTSSLRCFRRPCHAELPFCLTSFSAPSQAANRTWSPEVLKSGKIYDLFGVQLTKLLHKFLSMSFLLHRTSRKARCSVWPDPEPSWKVIDECEGKRHV